MDDPGRHARLGRLAPAARVVGLLAAHVAVHLEHAVVVLEHVVRDRPGERVLGVGVDVHLDHAVGDGLPDLLQRRAGAAVEDQVERLVLAVSLAHRVLDLLQHRRAQLDVPRLVDAVHVAERGGQDVPAALAEPERLGGGQGVFRRGVQLLVDLADDPVLLAADHADLHLHDDAGGRALGQQFGRDLQVLLQRHRRAVPHVRLEQRLLAACDPLAARSRPAGACSRPACPSGSGRCAARCGRGTWPRPRARTRPARPRPVTMSLTGPDRYSAPPVEIWTIPSLPASAKPRQRGVQRLARGAR